MGQLRRLWGLLGLAGARVRGRFRVGPQRVVLTVLGVALAVGLMVTVTGVSLGLASQNVVESEDVQYWIVPESADVQSVSVSTGGVQLGDVHSTSADIARDERVRSATPVLIEILAVRDVETGERTYVMAIGVLGQDGDVFGLNTDQLSAGDPHYANGTFDGPWTGEVLLNDAAATVTNASAGSTIEVARNGSGRSFTVVNVSESDAGTALGTTPVAVVHLSELQAITGAASGDQADQILVDTDDSSVRSALEDRYPRTTVVTRSGLGDAGQLGETSLPLAVAIAALLTAVVVGVLVVTTLMGLAVSADRQQLGTLAAIGVAGRSRSLLIAAETTILSVIGGVAGLALGGLGILAVNAAGRDLVGIDAVARFEPILIAYAIAVAIVIGLVGALYPVFLGRRTDPLEVLAR